MGITESKLKKGTLTIGTKSFATQATNVKITPDHKDDGEALEVLSGDQIPASSSRTDTLKIEAIQDFTDPAGFLTYTWEHDGENVAFEWTPTDKATPKWSGTVQVRALEVGGEINKRIMTSAEFPIANLVFVKADAAAPEFAIASDSE